MLTHAQLLERFVTRLAPEGIDDTTRLRMGAATRAVHAERDQPLRLDESCDQIVHLADGATKLVAHASLGREQIVAFHFTDDLVCLPAGSNHAYRLVALRSTDLLAIPYDKLLELVDDKPAILLEILDATRTSLARCREKSVALGRKAAPERLASFLVVMAQRIGERVGGAVMLRLPMARRDIADSLGITIETVSRQLTLLRQDHIVETIGRSGVKILNFQALTERAGFLPDHRKESSTNLRWINVGQAVGQ